MRYLSIDLESTGLEEDCHLIQIAFVPVDAEAGTVRRDLGIEFLVHCPSFDELKPKLNSWVKKHNESLIRQAHAEGLSKEVFCSKLKEYLDSDPIKVFFKKERIMLMGKSMTALDMPLMLKTLGYDFMHNYFHHHTVDLTGIGHALVGGGVLPKGHASGSKLVTYYKVSEELKHTALQDAIDMGEIYLKMIAHLKSLTTQKLDTDTESPQQP